MGSISLHVRNLGWWLQGATADMIGLLLSAYGVIGKDEYCKKDYLIYGIQV